MREFKYKSLTPEQKLRALADKYYNDIQWLPQVGDYYTSTRNDLELYKIVGKSYDVYLTNYCDPSKTTEEPARWPEQVFRNQGFAERRVWVHNDILEPGTDRWTDLDAPKITK